MPYCGSCQRTAGAETGAAIPWCWRSHGVGWGDGYHMYWVSDAPDNVKAVATRYYAIGVGQYEETIAGERWAFYVHMDERAGGAAPVVNLSRYEASMECPGTQRRFQPPIPPGPLPVPGPRARTAGTGTGADPSPFPFPIPGWPFPTNPGDVKEQVNRLFDLDRSTIDRCASYLEPGAREAFLAGFLVWKTVYAMPMLPPAVDPQQFWQAWLQYEMWWNAKINLTCRLRGVLP